jgi:PAS domain S-box-containing protein
MGQVTDFFKKLFDTSGFPARWHCGQWTFFHGWLYITSDLLIWSAYFTIPLIILRFLSRKHDARFLRLYVLFASFILACGATHFLDAVIFWIPLYRLSAVVKLITGIISWITVWQLIRFMPAAFAQRSVVVLEREIEQRKKAEEEVTMLNQRLEDIVWEKIQEVKATESRFRSIIENTQEAISLMDEEFVPFYQNPYAEQHTRWTELHHEGIIWYDHTHPEDAAQLKRILDEVLNNPGKAVEVNFRTLNAGGNYIYLEGTITNSLTHDYVKAIVFNLRDVTERKEIETKLVKSEKIYRAISANLPNCIITILDRSNTFILAEGEGLINTGHTKHGLEGKTDQQALDPEAFTRVTELRKLAFSGEVVSAETRYKNSNYLVRYIPLKDETGAVYAVMTISLDVTDTKIAEREIKALNETLEKKVVDRTEQLEIANKELEAFTYSVSHDLRAPLRIIHGYSDILKMEYAGKLEGEGDRLLGVIMNNVKQMGVLVDELLNFSRMGKKEVVLKKTNMTAVAEEVMTENMHEDNVVQVQIDKLLPAICDSYLIRIVWTNLISNAIKYSSKVEQPFIHIYSFGQEHYTVYAVSDNGIGFDMKYSHKLFGVFQRLHNKSDFEGSGVGLALVERIIIKHGGKVWAEAVENKGATFYFSLPIAINHGSAQS